MAKILHVECPACRAPMGLSERNRKVRCGYCGEESIVEGHNFLPEYYLPPELDRTQARRALQKILRCSSVPERMLERSRLISAELHYVPYNEICAKRIGELVISQHSPETQQKKKTNIDTRIVLSDVHRIEPAVQLNKWGLEYSGVKEIPESSLEKKGKMKREETARYSVIHEPNVDPDHLLESMKASGKAATVKDRTEFFEKRKKRLFYPIWRFKYLYEGCVYPTNVDGITGKIMSARAPQDDKQRVLWLLGVVMFVAFITGRTVRSIFTLIEKPEDLVEWTSSGAYATVAVLFLGLFLILIAVLVGWEQFRYPGEVIWNGEKQETIKLNEGESQPVQQVIDHIEKLLEKLSGKRGKKGL